MIVITGATGHTGKLISKSLLEAGKSVTAVGRSAENLQELTHAGALAAIGNLEDEAFLTQTFQGAEAAYLMIPPNWNPQPNWRAAQRQVATAITHAVRKSGLKKAILLSSHGAQLPEGAGPVTGLYEFETMLKSVPELDLLILRPGYFMENLFANIPMIQNLGFLGSILDGDLKMPWVHTKDIAAVAIRHLLDLSFRGVQIQYIDGPADISMKEACQIIAHAIKKPDLQYITFSEADGKQGMLGAGLAETIADGYIELLGCINSRKYFEGYVSAPEAKSTTSFQWFVDHELAPAILNTNS